MASIGAGGADLSPMRQRASQAASIVRFGAGAGFGEGTGQGCAGRFWQTSKVAGTSSRWLTGSGRGGVVHAVNNIKGSIRHRLVFNFINITYQIQSA